MFKVSPVFLVIISLLQEASVEYVRTPATIANNPTCDASLPPNQYAVGTEPPPPYTYSCYPLPEADSVAYVAGFTTSADSIGDQSASAAGDQSSYATLALQVPAYEETDSSGTSKGPAAVPSPNIPPPAYEELPPAPQN